ncbi:MAG: hypothetical protein EAZ65_06015 [Verrucomicrobia bacterium]|nr:MAG: hypothetical protein EAZ84_06815 [Verrucomicrobiota bacterium]TAE87721.1 MAG: hypothetical protein EAZ82_07120 [Verrucomicrobiota bacterium]TAF25346.1 MAG: hypothetical protein EAZ71_07625 [Verrucomicrobiota bacterium]TAF41132.1 MAG: hypothetical protein EAZ65_06015 [Verrucomicrobiota bacterium]
MPFSTAKEPRVPAQHLEPLEHGNLPQRTTYPLFQRFLEIIGHAGTIRRPPAVTSPNSAAITACQHAPTT